VLEHGHRSALAHVLQWGAAEQTMSDQNQPRSASGFRGKSRAQKSKPHSNGKRQRRKSPPRRSVPESWSFELGLEPLPKR
jgi:hypothetical protein